MATPARHRLSVLAAARLFSTGGTVIKAVSLAGAQVACLRSGIAFVALAVAFPSWRRGFNAKTALLGLAYGATMLLFVLANKRTTAASTIFLQATAPMYLLILGPLVLKEHARRSDLVLAGSMGIGLLLFLAGADAPAATAPDPVTGNLLAAASGLTWALTLLGLRWLGRSDSEDGASTGAAVLAGNLVACLATLPFAPALGSVTLRDGLLIAFLGVFQIGLAYVLLNRAVRHVPALEISLLLLAEPVGSALLAWAVHGEAPGPLALVGCALILVATVAMALRRAPD